MNDSTTAPTPGSVICRLPGEEICWGLFENPVEVCVAHTVAEVREAMRWLESKLEAGLYVAGFLSYEAGLAFDSAFQAKISEDTPLAWLAAYSSAPIPYQFTDEPSADLETRHCQPVISPVTYLDDVDQVLKYIYDGDIYQANYTFKSTLPEVTAPYQLFQQLTSHHPVPFCAYVDTGDIQVVSVSPELFLKGYEGMVISKPMKGTARRSPISEQDRQVVEDLAIDEKNCAENLMIVDMVRNDLGRICQLGSIKVDPIFHVDTYATVHQMISKVSGNVTPTTRVSDILQETFPAASITGAPKVRAMAIIDELEARPRGVYTGSIGCFYPYQKDKAPKFCLNVAIRSIICHAQYAELGIGSGVVADSVPDDEWQECLLKSNFINHVEPEFEVLETLLWTSDNGPLWLDAHLQRMCKSQRYFGRVCDEQQIYQEVNQYFQTLNNDSTSTAYRVRILLSEMGTLFIEHFPTTVEGWQNKTLKLKCATESVDSTNLFLYHKTTNRQFYNQQFAEATANGFDEVIFVNQAGVVTEGAISNIFILRNGIWSTPAVESGLLPGIWRSKMMCQLQAVESSISLEDLTEATEVIVGNSVRGTASASFFYQCTS